VLDLGARVGGHPLVNDLGGQLARHGVGAEHAGVDVKQFHGLVLGWIPLGAAMDEVLLVEQFLISRQNQNLSF
jgi:hypothetical protein